MTKRQDAGYNDPGRWASVACELPPESFMDHEEFMSFYQLPFDLCMELCNGSKVAARAMHWGQWGHLRRKSDESDTHGYGATVASD